VPQKGVISLSSVEGMKFDFVMCCHTLEHVSYPEEIVNVLSSVVAEDGVLYVELPFDSSFYRKKVSYYTDLLFNKNFSIKDKFFRWIESLKHPYSMSEHINFFTPKSIDILLKKAGFAVIGIEEFYFTNSKFMKWKSLGIVARKQKNVTVS
jgi:ubiquinone/menaquinone biosynthesis C-methylase UbiE